MPTEFSFEEATQPVKSFTFEEATAPKSFSFEEAQTTTATTPQSPLEIAPSRGPTIGTPPSNLYPPAAIEVNPKDPLVVPKFLGTMVEHAGAAALNIPEAMYREATGVTPKEAIIGEKTITQRESPLFFQPGKPAIEISKKTELQPEGDPISRIVEGFLTPGNIAAFPFAATKPVQAYFLAQTAPGAIDAASRLIDPKLPEDERKNAATDLLISGLMTAGISRSLVHGVTSEAKAIAPLTTAETSKTTEQSLGVPTSVGTMSPSATSGRGNINAPTTSLAGEETSRGLSTMEPSMVRVVEGNKILDPVVALIPVDVVDVLGGKESAAKMLLHDQAMLRNRLAANVDQDVLVRTWNSLREGIALERAKLSSLGDRRGNAEAISALDAIDNNLSKIGGTLVSSHAATLQQTSTQVKDEYASAIAKPESVSEYEIRTRLGQETSLRQPRTTAETQTEVLAPQTEKAVKEIVQPEDVSGGVLGKPTEVPSPQVHEEAAQPPPPPPAQPVGTEAGKAVDIKPGDKIKWEPNERERKYQGPVEGTVVDVISNTEGEKGYHVLVPLEGDPGNVVRVWDNRGKIVSHEPSQVEPPTVRAPKSSSGEVGAGRTPARTKTVVEIADEIAARGIDPQASYGQFVKARDLKPEISAKEWLPIYRKSLELAKLNKQIAISKRQSPTPEPPASQKPAPPAPTSEGKVKKTEAITPREIELLTAMRNWKRPAGEFSRIYPNAEDIGATRKEWLSLTRRGWMEKAWPGLPSMKALFALDKSKSKPTPPPTAGAGEKPISEGPESVAEQWILNAQKQASKTGLGKSSPDAALKVVSEWIREGKTPKGPIPKEVQDALMVSLKPTKDLETGEILGLENAEWPRTGTLLDFLESQAQNRIPGETPTRFGKGGPGAAAATEPGTYDPAAQLADALKTVKETDPLKRAQDISRVTELWEVGKDATTRAWGRVVAAKESIKDTLLNQDEITPLKRLVAALDFQIQKSSAMSRDLGRTFEQTHPNRVRRNAIAIFVDAGLDAEKVKAAISELPEKTPRRVRRAFEAAAELTPKERDTAERIKTYFEQRLQDAQQAGVLKGFLEDYYTHVWKKPERMPEELKNAMSNGRVVTYFENARQRSLQDFITGVKLGLEPVLDPALVVPRYNFNLDRAIASRAFVKKLSETTEADGRTTVAPTGIGRQVSSTEYVVRNDETGRTRRVFETREEADAVAREGESVVERENTATMISPKTKSPESEGYVVVDNPALRKWKWATNDSAGNPILVEGDLVVHPDAVNRIKNIMERERLTPGKSMRFLIRAGAEVKGAKLGVLSPFHQIHVGSHALFHLVNPFSLKPEIDWTHPFTKFAVEKGGLKLAADFHDKMAFSEGIGPGLIVQKIVPFARMYSEYLFESFIPRLKLKTFEAVYQRDLKRYEGKLSEEQIAARAGDAVNNAYGELNRLWLGKDGRDPRLQRAMQVTMLAPDFLEGRVRFVAKAFTKYGKEERMALFVMGASLYVTARVLNQLFDGDPHANEPNMMFSVRVGDKNYSIRSVLGDLNHFLTDWRSFASTRINPVTTRTAVELLTKRDIRTGESVTTAQEAADMLRQVVPSQLDSMLPGDRQWWFGFMQSLGLTARRQPTPEEIAKRKAKEEKEKEHPSKVEIIYKKRGVPDVIGTPSSKKKR